MKSKRLRMLSIVTEAILKDNNNEVYHLHVPAQAGRRDALVALTLCNVAVFVNDEAERTNMRRSGGAINMLFTDKAQIDHANAESVDFAPYAVVFYEGNKRKNLNSDIEAVREKVECPIIVLATSEETEQLWKK